MGHYLTCKRSSSPLSFHSVVRAVCQSFTTHLHLTYGGRFASVHGTIGADDRSTTPGATPFVRLHCLVSKNSTTPTDGVSPVNCSAPTEATNGEPSNLCVFAG